MVWKTGIGNTFEEPKTVKSRRDVAVDDHLLDELKRHKASQAKERLLLGMQYQDNDLINCN